jgi:hypothetical protein
MQIYPMRHEQYIGLFTSLVKARGGPELRQEDVAIGRKLLAKGLELSQVTEAE